MAATANTSALSPRATAGDSIGAPHTPTRRTSSPPWNQIVTGPQSELSEPLPPPPESPLVAAVAPPPLDGSSPDGSETEITADGADNGAKKAAWSKPYNVAPESGLVMGAVSWPTLSESTKASPKLPPIDPLKNPTDPPVSPPQVAAVIPSISLSNNPSPSPNAARPARQRSMKREGGGYSSPNGGFGHQFPQSSSAGENNSSLKASSDGAVREHGHGNVSREGGGYRSGGEHPQQRNFRRNHSGSHLRGDGNFGGRRDQDRGNHDWNHHRGGFNGRDPVGAQQRVSPRGYVRAPPPGAAAYVTPPPIRPYGSPMGIPPEMQPLYYFAPHPGMPFVAQMPPAVYYPPMDPQFHAQIINQIDYYFSNENLVKDIYLRQNMDEQGWVPVQLIANFKKVMQLTTDIQLILNTVQASTVVEVKGDKIRKRDDWMKWIMPSSVQFQTAAASQSPPMWQDALPARVQGLVLDEKTANYGNSSQVDVHAGILLRSSSGDTEGVSETSKDGRSSSGC